MKKLVLVLVVFLVSCGWERMYVARDGNNSEITITDEMTEIKVESINGRFGQQVRNNLLDSLTPQGIPAQPRYKLKVQPAQVEVIKQAMRNDITATRERATYKVNYKMMEGDEEVLKGNSIAYVSYDILSNPYSTTIASKKAETDAAKIIADDIVLRIGAYFHTKANSKEIYGDF